METNRTIEILKTYNFAQKNHWQLMCDLSNNDYDIHYFDGRQSANVYLDEFLQTQENNCYNEFYRGMVAEIELLVHIVKQEY